MKELILPYKPRAGQSLLAKLVDQKPYFTAVCHRGFGKSIFAISQLIKWALKRPGVYAYVAPEKAQGKKITWDTVKDYLAKVPEIRFNEAELYAALPNGSKIYLEGAEKPDRIRGLHMSGVVLDEVADMPSETWEAVVFPALQINRGNALFIGTPKGDNIFKDFFLKGEDPELQDQWGSVLIDVYTSGVFENDYIENVLRKNMPPALFAQEYLCRFDARFDGAYYGEIFVELEKRGQLSVFGVDLARPVYTGWDLGLSDKTCIWFAQLDPLAQQVHIIDYIEDSNKPITYYLEQLNRKPYIYAKHFLPHDADRRSMSTGANRLDVFKAHGHKYEVLAKSPDINADIAAVQTFLYKCSFDGANVKEGLKHLKSYSATYNRITGEYQSKPKHDTHSDGADAFRYLVLGAAKEFTNKRAEARGLANNQGKLVSHISPLANKRNLQQPINRPHKW